MKLITLLSLLTLSASAIDAPPADWIAAGEAKRDAIPLGGDFKPQAKVPAFVAVGHGARILVSKDDGQTWTQSFFGYPGSDHGGWATNAVAYQGGVFAVCVGWTQPTSYLASDDGTHWRHLTSGKQPLAESKGDPDLMPTTMSLAAGKGTFVGSGYMTFTATPDLGQTWTTSNLWGRKDPAGAKLSTHHIRTLYLGDASGRFLALGENRGKEGPKFGHLFTSDDAGKSWQWLTPQGLEASTGTGTMVTNGKLIAMTDNTAEHVWTSNYGGQTWTGPHATGTKRATLSMVKGEFWLTGKPSRASQDGVTWRDLPATVPAGKIIAANGTGTLISIDRQRFNVMRSADGGATWKEVFTFQPSTEHVHGSQGLRDVAFGYLNP